MKAPQDDLTKNYDLSDLANVLDAAPDPMLVLEGDGKIVCVNQVLLQTFGYEQLQLIHQPVEILVPSRFRHQHVGLRDDYMRNPDRPRLGGPGERQLLGLTSDGTELPIEITINPTRLADQEVVVVAIRDLKQTLAVIRQSEVYTESLKRQNEQFKLMLELSPLAAAFAVDGTFVYVNPKMREIFGVQVGDTADHIYESNSQRVAVRETLEKSGAAIDMEVRMIDCDGGVREVVACFYHAEMEGQSGILGWLNDVTDGREAERALLESEHRLRDTANAASVGLWEYAPQEDRLIVNKVALAIAGYTPEVLPVVQGDWLLMPGGIESIEEAIHSAYIDETKAEFGRLLRGEITTYTQEYPLRQADGTWKWIRSVGRVMECNVAGWALRVSGIHIDIDQEKQLQRQLTEARDQAEAATQAKSDFLAKVTHEIRTPLSALKGYVHLAKRTDNRSRLLKYLDTSERSIDYVARIIDDILDFSKIEAGKLELEELVFDVRETVDYCASLLRVRSDERDVVIELQCNARVPHRVAGDSYRLQQIIVNLMSNAIKFSDPGGRVAVSISLDELREDSCVLQFSVKDTGLGMTLEEQKELFQNYKQVSNSIARTHGGTGLGLAICRQLCELMGGHIRVESEKGIGSTFTVTLPYRFDLEERAELPLTDDPLSDLTATDMSNMSVLVVEDNLDNQEVVKELLELEGVTVMTANNGAEAIERLNEQSFSLVLMDCQMPVMDGYAATRAIRENPRFSELPIIAMTGNVMQADLERAFAAGMNDYIAKPLDPERLLSVLEEL